MLYQRGLISQLDFQYFSLKTLDASSHCSDGISHAVPLRIARAHGAPVEVKRKREKEGIGHRDTLMSFSRDVPGAETIDKRRELEVRESHEVGSFGNKEGKKREVGIKERRKKEKRRGREKATKSRESGELLEIDSPVLNLNKCQLA